MWLVLNIIVTGIGEIRSNIIFVVKSLADSVMLISDLLASKMSTTLKLIGGNTGEWFSLTGKKNGASLTRIWVWVGPSEVKAVRVWLSDGQNKTYGSPEGDYTEYMFQAGERITSLSLWGNGNGTRLGGIKFKTSLKNDFFVKMTCWGLKTEYPIDVGSGFCLGVEGRSGCAIDCMGFVFVNTIRSVVVTNVKYPTIENVTPQVASEELKSITYTNESSVSQQQTVSTLKKIVKTSSWSVSNNITAAFSVEVQAKIPGIGKSSTGLSTTVGNQNTYSCVYSKEKTDTISTIIEVPPRKRVNVKITIGRCTLVLPYTGTVMMTCTNGSVFSFQTEGQYKGVTYTDVNIETKESDLS